MRHLLLFINILFIACQMREEIANISYTSDIEITYDVNDYIDIKNITDANNIKNYECIRYNIKLSENNDDTDIYLPNTKDKQFYTILLLQGSDLPKENYQKISTLICNYGFIVAVFDHYKESFSGRHLYSEQNATTQIFQKMIELSKSEESFLYNKVRSNKFILLGHSYGAGCGLFMIGNECKWPFCSDSYQRADELSGGIFYGISLKSPYGETYYKINNDGIPVLLINGDNDGVIKIEFAEKTFESIQTPPKVFVRLKGANHYAINDSNPPPEGDADQNIQTLNQEKGLYIISKLSALFIQEYIVKNINFTGSFETALSEFSEFIETKREF